MVASGIQRTASIPTRVQSEDTDAGTAAMKQRKGARRESRHPEGRGMEFQNSHRPSRAVLQAIRAGTSCGKMPLYLNAFCDENPPAYRRQRRVIVADGATCYWQAFYDPATKKYSHLTINARA
jgi:hypothetical protein